MSDSSRCRPFGNWTHPYYQISHQNSESMKAVEPLRKLWNKVPSPPKTTIETPWSSERDSTQRKHFPPRSESWDSVQLRSVASRAHTTSSQLDDPFRRKFTKKNVGGGQPLASHQSVEEQRKYVVRQHRLKYQEQYSAFEAMAKEVASRMLTAEPSQAKVRGVSLAQNDHVPPNGTGAEKRELARPFDAIALTKDGGDPSAAITGPTAAADAAELPTYYPDAIVARSRALLQPEKEKVENLACKSVRLCEPAKAPAATIEIRECPPLPDHEYYAQQAEKYRKAAQNLRNRVPLRRTDPDAEDCRLSSIQRLADSDRFCYFFRRPMPGFGGHVPKSSPDCCREKERDKSDRELSKRLLAGHPVEYRRPEHGRCELLSKAVLANQKRQSSSSGNIHSLLHILQMYRGSRAVQLTAQGKTR